MSNFFKNSYFNTYYYSNIISNILSGDIELIGFISNFFSDNNAILNLVKPYQKFSGFHEFIKYMIWDFFNEDMNEYDKRILNYAEVNKYPLEKLYAEIALENFQMNYIIDDFIEIENRNNILTLKNFTKN